MPLAPVVSALARQTIKTACEELQRTISPSESREFGSTTLDHVRKAVLELENQLAARRSLRYMRRLSPLFKGLEHYSKVLDILCNGTPFMPWVWAPITLILRVASEHAEAFEQIIKGYSRISSSLLRLEILSDAFVRNQDFQQTLAVFYADILAFHKHAYQFVKRSGWQLLFLTSWGRFQRRFDGIIEDMKRHENLIDLEANARNIAESRKAHQDIRTWREEQLEIVSRFEEEQAANQYQSIMSWLKIDESDQLAIFDLAAAEGLKHPGTCSWILKHPKMTTWLQRKQDLPFLRLEGSAGCGKSVLSSQLVNFIKTTSFVMHHFCSYAHASSTKYEDILKSLLLQLLRRDGDLCAHVYKRCILEKQAATRSALDQLLRTAFASMSNDPSKPEYIWIVFDGLEQCTNDTQARVMSLMEQISSTKSSSTGETICKVLVSSRSMPAFSSRSRKRQVVSLADEKEHLHAAIGLYSSQRLHSLLQKLSQLSIGPGDLEEIARGITTKADGMFLYARLVLDHITTNIFYSADEIKSSVHQLPPELNDFYHEILNRIIFCLDSRSRERVKCALGWIAFAKRPLRKLELLSAISFSEGNSDTTCIAPRYMFLQSPSTTPGISEQDSLLEQSIACVTCLLSGLEVFEHHDEQARYLRVVKGLHGLHIYATEYWTEYLLTHVASTFGLQTTSCFFSLVQRLAGKLDLSADPYAYKETPVAEERLKFLQEHPIIYRQVERAVQARSLARMKAQYSKELAGESSSTNAAPAGIGGLLESYQRAVRALLDEHAFPGATAEELEAFKTQFRHSAFTCRLGSCPRATVGFDSNTLRAEHERSHIRQLRCTFPGCHYPLPFGSDQALKAHANKYHVRESPRNSIRLITETGDRNGVSDPGAPEAITNSPCMYAEDMAEYSTRPERHGSLSLEQQKELMDMLEAEGLQEIDAFLNSERSLVASGVDWNVQGPIQQQGQMSISEVGVPILHSTPSSGVSVDTGIAEFPALAIPPLDAKYFWSDMGEMGQPIQYN
ncbi:hypothetical protein GQ53DRAFT_794643 [Thozetella sp. PMI_491]|nr:hypothetical protein GQ53DRAFT_794643 [Thozetella sp. PMI_491]